MGDVADPWRAYFRATECDIFEIIENGIRVAASDHPEEFRRRRGRMVEYMFSCRFCKCQGCDKCVNNSPVVVKDIENGVNEECEVEDGLELDERSGKAAENADGVAGEGNGMIRGQRSDEELDVGKEADVNVDGTSDEGNEMSIGQDETSLSDEELDLFAKEIERECLTDEILEIKEVILDGQVQDYSIILDSLKKLQSLALPVAIMKETGIGKVVGSLRRHGAKDIRNLARALIQNWKQTSAICERASGLDSAGWISGKKKTVERSKESEEDDSQDSINGPAFHQKYKFEQFPPVDEAAFLTGHPPMELSSILDDIDEQGNITMSDEMSGNKRKYVVQKPSIAELKQMSFGETDADVNGSFQQKDKPVNFKMPSDPDSAGSATDKPAGKYVPTIGNKSKSWTKSEDLNFSKRPKVGGEQNRVEPTNKNAEEAKFESAKKKLLDGYVQVQKGMYHSLKYLTLNFRKEADRAGARLARPSKSKDRRKTTESSVLAKATKLPEPPLEGGSRKALATASDLRLGSLSPLHHPLLKASLPAVECRFISKWG